MKITNLYALPTPIQQAVVFNDTLRGDLDRRTDIISVTKLIAPVQITYLTRKHWDQLSEDVLDRLWALFGQAVHAILSWQTPDNDTLIEHRLAIPIADTGMTLTGQFDRLHVPSGTLSDWKTTAVWSIQEGVKWEWEAQLNLLKYICQAHGFQINRLEVVAILRDWSATQAKGEHYPPLPVVTLPVKLWSEDDTYKYILERITLHQQAFITDQPAPCTDQDRWQRPNQYAVKKPGAARAIRVMADENEAQRLVEKTPGAVLEVRSGKNIRCERFCAVAPFCNQFNPEVRMAA